jgi:hypothetical protein
MDSYLLHEAANNPLFDGTRHNKVVDDNVLVF